MSHADVYAAVSPVVPIRHMEWAGGSAPALPWAVYDCEDTPICAGNEQIAVKHRYTVELYEVRRDAELELSVANAIRAAFGAVTRDESWVEDGDMLQVRFTFYQIEGDFDG